MNTNRYAAVEAAEANVKAARSDFDKTKAALEAAAEDHKASLLALRDASKAYIDAWRELDPGTLDHIKDHPNV